MKEIRATTQHDYVLTRSSAAPERRLRRKILLLAVMPLVIACLVLLMTDSRYPVMFLASALLGLAAGGMLPIWGSLMAVLFGAANYGRVMGLMNPVMMPVVVAGAPFAGWSYDRSGSYTVTLVAFTVVLVLGLLALARIRMPALSPKGGSR